jgi:glutathione synthase/RimK-type ligase-like ATP-grasp enzyme
VEATEDRSYLVQPFIESVVSEGEWAFIYFHGALSHVLLKTPAPGDFRVQGIYGGTVRTAVPDPRDLRRAEAVMAGLPHDPLVARLDMVRVDGGLAVMEVELIEPVLDLDLAPGSADRLAQALRTVLGEQT